MQASYEQTSFMSGEWSLTMQGRTDHSEYRKALAACVNAMILETEAWTRRPGTITSGPTRQGQPGKLIKYDFAQNFPYTMEFTTGFLRFWAGASIASNNDDQAIASISTANPAVVQTALNHGWATGNTVTFPVLFGSTVLLGRQFTITVVDATHFSIADALTGLPINGAGFAAITGTVRRVQELITPYAGSSWSSLRAVQAQTNAILLNGTLPQIVAVSTQPSATQFATFSLTPINFQDGPYLDPFPGSIATPSATKGNISLTLSFQPYDATFSYSLGDYVSNAGVNYKSLQNANLNNTPATSPTFWAVVSGGDPIGPNGFVPSDVGRHVRLFSEPALWASGTAYTTGNVVAYGTNLGVNLYYIAIAGSTGVIPGTDVTKWNLVSGATYALWSWGRIISVSGAGIIAGNIAGAVHIGSLISFGGINAAFDGNLVKQASLCAGALNGGGSSDGYVGQNYTGAAAQQISQATAYPATDYGFGYYVGVGGITTTSTITLNLRAKQTAPTAPNDGTLLGTSGAIPNQFTPITVQSSDQVTAWNYVWIEALVSGPSGGGGGNPPTASFICQVVFYNPNVANGSVATVQIAGPALLYTSAVRTWRLGVYSNTTGWPTTGCYHEGRLWLAGSVGNRFDFSMSNQPYVFSPTQIDGTVAANNAGGYVLNSTDVNLIQWMLPRVEGVICGTLAGEWLVQATALNNPITPLSIQAHRYTKIKCANIEPCECEHTTVFVQKHKRRIMEYFADIFSGKFSAPNITYKSSHMTAPGIAEIRYQQDLLPVVWVRLQNNTLAGITYKRESLMSRDGPTIAAAHRHPLGSGRSVESMAVGPAGIGGDLEALSMITTDGTYRYVEVMAQIFQEADLISSAQFLDGAIIPTSYQDIGTGLTFNGLWLLNGQTVNVFAGGLDCGAFTVTNGSITVPYGDGISGGTAGGQFTSALVASFAGAMPALVGFLYTSQGQILRPNTPQESGTRQGPAMGKVRRTHRAVAQVVNALSGYLFFGTIFAKLFPAFFRTPNGPVITTAFSGTYKETLKDAGLPLDSMLAWQVNGPFPCTITALAAFLDTEDE